jgi:transcriptional regulator of aromatic amino acid metabolism
MGHLLVIDDDPFVTECFRLLFAKGEMWVLQDGQFECVGRNETIKTKVRVITATNRN